MRPILALAPLSALWLLLPQQADAQTSNEPIIVTANRAPVRPKQVGQSMTVIDAETIEASQAIGVSELVAQTPGVQVRRNGGRGTATSVFIRGAETGQSVILYDGVLLHDPSVTDGGASLADLMTGDIDRIEILRGAQSTLYGSQAIGGVIQIFTREPERPFEASLRAEAGERDSYLVRGAIGGKQDALTWRAGAGYTVTDGISAYAPGTESDGYANVSLNGRLTYAVSSDVSLDLRSFYTEGDVEFDGFNADALNRGKTQSLLNRADLNFRLLDRLDNRIAYERTDIDRVNSDESNPSAPVITFDASGKTDRFEYQGTLDIQQGAFAVFGVDYAEDSYTTSSYSAPPTGAMDDTLGIYGQLTFEPVHGLTLTGGLRQEDHSAFGGNIAASASAAWSLNQGGTILRASYAEGFKAPSLFQLYSSFGNSALAPEEAASWDIGIEQWLGDALMLSATYFNRDSQNLVDFVSCSADPANPLCDDGRFGFYDNVGLVETQGVELGASLTSGPFSASANYTWLDASNVTPGSANRGNALARRADNTFNASTGYTCACGLAISARLSIVGDSFNDAGNTQIVASYALVDLRVSYPVTDQIEIYARADNLFDEDYETVRDAGTLPRVLYAGARLSF